VTVQSEVLPVRSGMASTGGLRHPVISQRASLYTHTHTYTYTHTHTQGITGGTDQTSGGCSLC